VSTYCTQANVEAIYGTGNVDKWLTLASTDNSAAKTARINALIAEASETFDEVAREAGYHTPMANDAGTTPVTVQAWTARWVGVLAYEARGVDDFDNESGQPYHRLTWARRECLRRLRDLATGAWVPDAVRG
jgi:hypothetical protein